MKTVALLACFGILAAGLRAGEPAVARYTLDPCLRLARERGLGPANARRDLTAARAGIRESRADAVPQLELKAGYTRIDEVPEIEFGGSRFSFGSENTYNTAAELKQLLYNGGQVNAAIRAARAYERFARQGIRLAEAAQRREVRLGFLSVLLAEARVGVRDESVEQLRRYLRNTESRYRQQAVSEYDWLTARVRFANELPRQIVASNHLAVARESFRRLACLDEGPFILDGELDAPDPGWTLDALLAGALTNRAEVLQLEQTICLREENLNAARDGNGPTARAFANYAGGNQSAFDPTQSEWEWHWTAGLTFEWALFDGGRRSGRVLGRRMELEKSRAELEDLRRQVTLEVRQAFLELADARAVLATARENVALAERGLAIAQTRYEQGVATYLELMDANLALSTARLQSLEAAHAHHAALVRGEYAASIEP
jgi:outer membrane protein TolC